MGPAALTGSRALIFPGDIKQMEKIKKYLNLTCYRQPGFYVAAAASLIGLIGAIVFGVGFGKETLSEYYSVTVVILPVIGFVAFIVLEAFEKSAEYAPVAMWALEFSALLSFIASAYMYLSGIFYNGISADALAMIDPAFMGTAVLLIIACIAGNVAIWLKQSAKKQKTEEKLNEEGV